MKKRSFLVMLVMGMMVTNVLMLGMWFAPHIGHINEPDIGERGVNDGLIAHYEFNNGTGTVLYDHGPNGFNGTLAGGIPDWSAGRWSRGLHFDGVSDYVDIGDVAKYIGKNGVQSVALTAWVNYTALGDLEIIGDDDLHIFAELQVESTNGTIHFWMENSTDADFRVWSNSALNDGKWHFIVGQYNYTTGKMQIWVDGVLNQERTYFFTPANTPTNYYIGDGDNYPFNGSIDEVRIYDRTLSPEEIAFLYNYSDVHDPIYISGDAGFAAFAQSEHIAGNGSAANPYEISGYYIDAKEGGNAIYIGNTTVHFIVDECYLYNATYHSYPYFYGAGITLYNVTNATIDMVNAETNYVGFFLYNDTSKVSIENSRIYDALYGIYVEGYTKGSNNNTFIGNTLENISFDGIYFYKAYNSTVVNNTLDVPGSGIYLYETAYNIYAGNIIKNTDNGIYIDAYTHDELFEENKILNFSSEGIYIYYTDNVTLIKNYIQNANGSYTGIVFDSDGYTALYSNTFVGCGLDRPDFETVILPDNNTVNGQPVVFYRNVNLNNLTINVAGQVLLYNVSWVNLRNLSIESVPYGIYGNYLSNITVDNVSISNNERGIWLENTENVTINGSSFYNFTSYGIHLEYVHHSSVKNTTVVKADGYGIYIDGSDYNKIEGNTVKNSYYGIYISGAYNYIAGNTIIDSSYYGVEIYGDYNTLTENIIKNSTNYGIHIASYRSGNLIYRNYLYYNHGSTDKYNSSHIQAVDYGSGNYWNSSTIGNYWYDWASNNDTNDLNYDGIVDWPYSIVGGVRDEYPISNFRGAIRINSDSDFTPDNGVVGGKGTQDDPYLIMNWIIDAHRGPNAIYIGNTTKYFRVEHCELYNTTYVSLPYYYGSAITLYNVTNGYIGYNDIHDTDTYGVFMNNTHSVVLEHNLIHNNYGYGSVWLRYSTDVTFVGNEIINNYQGIYFTSSSNNTLWDNYFRGNTGSAICIYTGSGNIIYGNYFYFNDGSNGTYNSSHIQAADYSGSNYWNSSTTGNYWYDWAYNNDTNDQNRDGIVDWPYIIAGGTGVVDNYPLSRFRGVIRINGDYDFNPDNGVIAGTGTRDDPYLISGWCIDANGAGSGIYIGNVTSYFVVDGVFLNNTNYSSYPYYTGAGITLYNSSAGEIRNITSENNEMVGVMVANSEWIYLHNSTLTSNIYGLYLESSNNITVSGVVINKNKYGVYAEESNYNVFEYDNINNNTDYGLTIATGTYNEISSSDIWGNGGEGVVISGGSENRIVYTKVHDNAGTGIKILSSKNDLILEAEIYSNSENGTYLSSSNNINITGAEIYSNNRNGVYIYDSYSNIVRESNITYNGANGVYVEYYSYNNTIIGNNISFNLQNVYVNGCTQTYIYSNEMWLWGNTANIYFDQALHSVIYNNTLGRGAYGIKMNHSTYITLENNTYLNSSSSGLFINTGSNNTVRNDTAAGCVYGFYIVDGRDNTFENLTAYDSQYYGLWITGEFNDTVSGGKYYHNGLLYSNYHGIYISNTEKLTMKNILVYSNLAHGIYVSSSKNITIANSSIYGNGAAGVNIYGSSGVITEYCDIYSNFDGLWLSTNSANNTVRNCTVHNNTRYGIRITSSSNDNLITGNYIENNTDYGIYINLSHRNSIYSNHFYYNDGSLNYYNASHVQAYDDSSDNYWNTSGTPNGYGNIWCDWANNNNTNDLNGDGIVDWPYHLDGGAGAVDYYPLANSTYPVPEINSSILWLLLAIVSGLFLYKKKKDL